ncbi:amidohydrolase family protein [Mesorhizobium sp. BR1-1-9]|uniref:amidohydrolase family protein n=1 Tax=unclassified Mesorhizobium TaxID=325217 RepID=UPI00112AF43A|nr:MULTISPECIES: amidohydrolase family protein [unclassified Mesorhizobium]MBZ9811125.1 amidohydrolase family protein [Mesorhizobium sp. ESP-6-2]MBZ9872359.1 amidohydrolase family protein [Mesorhizobium sp. BR1-1-9]TPM22577.1 amidohydrolase [Mesorhizobium sp. B2-2-2]
MFIVDCDCHNYWSSATVLEPYLSGIWKDMFIEGEKTGPRGSFPHGHRPWFHPQDFSRKDVRPETEADNYRIMKEKHLDKYNVGVAILTGDEPIEASTLANPYYASALVSAYNDYQVAEWLPKDNRFMGSIIIAPQDPKLAAAEIRRLGSHPRMVQVLASQGSVKPYGDPFYHPIYEACAEMGLPFAIHLGGHGGVNWNAVAPAPTTFFWETHAILHMSAISHVASMIAHGVFEKWPELYFVIVECGVAWVPTVLWRLDADYKALRKETPWLKMLPSEYCRRNIRFSTQPLEQPANVQHLWSILEAMDGENTLMFASDYPHWDYDDANTLHIPPAWRTKVMGQNALNVYKRIPAVLTANAA